MAIAASVAIALTTIGLSLVMPARDDDASTQVANAGNVQASETRHALPRIVRLGKVRSQGTTPDVAFALNAAPSELRFEPADVVVLTCADGSLELECTGGLSPQTPQYPEYEMDVVSRGDSTLAWRSSRQAPTTGGGLSFVLHRPEQLAAGDYDLVVRGHSPEHEEVVARFWLRVN